MAGHAKRATPIPPDLLSISSPMSDEGRPFTYPSLVGLVVVCSTNSA